MNKQKIIDFVLQEGEGYKVEGIVINERLKSQIQDIARNCDPPAEILLETIHYKDKKVLLINVFEGDNKPYACSEGFFIRNGTITEKLRRNEIVVLFQREGKIRFDKLINPKFCFDTDFDLKKLEDFLSRAEIKTNLNAHEILVNLGVAEKQEGKLFFNNSGILFFAKDTKNFFESAYITCARFKGNDRSTVIDRVDIYGNPINQVEEGMKFLKRNIRLGYEELGKRASRRNELIADLFFRVGFGEKMGSGIARMNQ